MKNKEVNYYDENATLDMKERVGYGIGDFANNMMFTPVNIFVTYFFTNILGIGAGIVGTILLISRIFDGVSDLIVGILMEKFNSKHGKARPWLLWWCIPFAVSLVLLFTAPDFGMKGKIIYAFLTYNLAVTIVYTAINLPFGSLAALMTRNQQERGYLNVSKMIFAFTGGLVCSMATLPLVEKFGGDARAWQLTFIIYGIIAAVLFLVVFFSTTERVKDIHVIQENSNQNIKIERPKTKDTLKSLMKNKYWLIMLVVFFLNNFGNALIGVNVFYGQYIMKDNYLVGNLSLYQTISSLITFVVMIYIMKKCGKQKIAFWGSVISFIGYAVVLVAPESYPVLYVSALIKGVGNAALSGVMYGMLADTVEYNEWKSGIRAEGLVFSANSIGAKIGSGFGGAALGWILAWFGYVSASNTQSETTIMGIRVIFLYVPLVVFALQAFLTRFYKLDEEYDGIIKELDERKNIKK